MENPRNGLRKNPIDVANWYMDEVKAADQADWKVTLIPGVSPEELAYGQIMYPIEVMPDELVPGNREILMNTIERVVLVDPMDPTMNWRIAPQAGRGVDRGKFWRTMASETGSRDLKIDVYRETLQESINALRRPRGGDPGLLIKRVILASGSPSKKRASKKRSSKKKSG